MALTKISTAMISQSASAVDLNIDAGTLYVDATNNRVGVGGKTDPATPLHVTGTVTATLFAGSGASLTGIPNGALTNSSITINSSATSLGGSITLTTANIAENTNLYYTNARADARIAAADTNDLSEGSSNLYYTDARVNARVAGGSLGNITTTGYIRGPATFTIDPATHGDNTGTVVIAGNLQVDGTQTTINSTTLTVDDKNITLASGSANASAASGAGFTVDIGSGTNPSITYDGTNDEWDFNKPLNVTGNIAVSGTVDGIDIAARDGVLTSTTTTAGAALPKAGGTLSGNLLMGDNDITGINKLSILDSADNNRLEIYGNASNSFIFDMGGTGAVGKINFNDFNVGIGIAAPAEALHVAGGNLSAIRNNGLRIISNTEGAGAETNIMHNAYYSSGYKYGVSDEAARINFVDGKMSLQPAAAGSANAAITWIQGITILANGKVGIGTPAPVGKLHVYSGDAGTVTPSAQADDLVVEASTEGGITIMTPNDQSARIRFTSPATESGDLGGADIFYRQNINKMSIGTTVSGGKLAFKSGAGVETMVLNGGNVLVGKSTPNIGVVGQELRGDGSNYFTSTNDTALGLNRLASDGTVLEIRRQSAIVGAIGTYGGDLWVGQGNTGLIFNDGGDVIHVANASGGDRNGVCDLGNTASRFKDIHLAGAVYAPTLTGVTTINTASSTGVLEIYGGATNKGGKILLSGGNNTSNGSDIRFHTGSSTANPPERMRIDSSGKLLLGDLASHTSDLLQIETPASGGGHGIQIRRNDSNTDQGVGSITFGNNTATDLASISAKTDGATDNGALLFNTSVSGGANTERMRITSAGNIEIKQSGSAPTNSVRLPGYIEFKGQGWDSNSGSDDMNAKIEMAATYGNVGSGATSPELVFSLQGAGGLDSSSEAYVEGMRLVGAGANNGNQPRLGIGTTTPDLTLDVTHATAAQYIATFQNTGSNLKLKFGCQAQGYLNIQGARIDNGNPYNLSLQSDGGDVGIGTTLPNSRLMVIDTTDARKQIEFSNHATYRGSIGHDAGSGFNEYRTEADGGKHAFYRGATSTTPEMVIDNNGKVGIGTAAPASLLDVGGGLIADPTIRIDSAAGGDPSLVFDTGGANRGATIKFHDNGSSAAGFINYVHNGDKMNFGAGSTTGITMTLSDGIVTMPSQPGFFARGNTSQWLQGSNGWNKLIGGIAHGNGAEIGVNLTEGNKSALNGYDSGSDFNTSNGRFTAPVDGKYHIHGSIYCMKLGTNANDYMHFLVYVNGQQINEMYTMGGHGAGYAHDFSLNISSILYLEASDYVEWKIYVAGGTNMRIYGDHLCIGAHLLS